MNFARHLPAPRVPLALRDDALLMSMRGDYDDAINAAHKTAYADLEGAYPFLDKGAQRAVFDGGTVVYKIALTEYDWGSTEACMDASLEEVDRFESGYDGIPVAPCRLVWHASGVPIVVMEKVTRVHHDCHDDSESANLPWWHDLVDGSQLGWSSLLNGWVVYDAGVSHFMNSDHIERLQAENEAQGEQAA